MNSQTNSGPNNDETRPRPDRSGRIYALVLHGVLVALAITSLALVGQNRELRERLTPPPQVTAFEAGDQLAAIPVVDLQGQTEELQFDDGQQLKLVLFMTTTCGACRENQSRWQQIHEAAGQRFDVVGVSMDNLDDTIAYRNELGLPYRLVSASDPQSMAKDLGISLVPETVLVDSDGRVLKSWLGVLDDEALQDLGVES